MRKTVFLSAITCLSLICLNKDIQADENHYVLNDMTKGSFLDFCEGQTESIILLEEGTILPIKFQIDGSSFSFQGDKTIGSLTVKEPFYMKVQNKEPYFSKDKEQWKSFFHFFAGQIFFGLCVDELNEQPYTQLKFDISQK